MLLLLSVVQLPEQMLNVTRSAQLNGVSRALVASGLAALALLVLDGEAACLKMEEVLHKD